MRFACFRGATGFSIRSVDAGAFFSIAFGRIGRGTKLPPQLGQTFLSN